jgi:hypothetical protein
MFRFGNLARRARLAGGLFLSLATLQAQAPDSASDKELIQRLLQRIDQLEKRVADLESHAAPPATAAAPSGPPSTIAALPPQPTAAVTTATPSPMAEHDHGTPVETSTSTYPSLRIAGFGDLNYSSSDQRGSHGGFNEGQFVLHLSSALSSHVTYFGELSLTARTDAGTGTPPATGFNVEVERSIIRYDYSDRVKLSFGRYHTPISYWNTQFHHGSWLQTTAARPEMVQFGGSFIPIHFVGALAEGAFPAGGLNLNYNVGIGNGRSSVLSRAGDWGDVNNNRAWLTTVFIRPDRLYGLQAGASVYRDKVDATGRPEAREWIESAHLVWAKENPEFIAEFFNISHQRPGSSVITNDQAWYAQLAYRLPNADHWKPYYRYEYIHTPLADPIFSGLNLSMSGSTFGVRYDISSFAAFKLEWRNQNRPGLGNINVGWAQTDFTF